MTFSEKLTEAIKSSGKTMKAVAEELEVPYRSMQNWKNGVNVPSKLVQNTILNALNNIQK